MRSGREGLTGELQTNWEQVSERDMWDPRTEGNSDW